MGFFALDFSYDRHRDYLPKDKDFAVLRCFFIDKRFQNQGLAKRSIEALFEYMAHEHPHVEALYLTVNFKNEAAVKSYQKAQFKLMKQPYLGGSAGPQHVMVRSI